jgi:hypothetical protein
MPNAQLVLAETMRIHEKKWRNTGYIFSPSPQNRQKEDTPIISPAPINPNIIIQNTTHVEVREKITRKKLNAL